MGIGQIRELINTVNLPIIIISEEILEISRTIWIFAAMVSLLPTGGLPQSYWK